MSRVVRNVTGEPYRLHIRRECVLKCSPSSKPPDGVRGAGVIQIVEMGPAWYFRFVNVNPHLPNVAGGVPPEVWVHTTVGRPRARMSKLRAGSHVGQRLTLEKGWRGRFRGRDVEGKRAPRGGDEPNPHAKAGTIFLEPIGADVEAEMRAMKGMAIFKEPDTAPFTVDPVIYAYGVFKPYLLGRVKIRAMEEEQARKAAAMLHIEMMYRDMYGSTDLDSTAWAAGAPPPPITALYERAQMKPEDVARYAYTRLKMRARETADFETFGRLLQAIDIYRTQAKMRILFEVGDLDHTGDVDFTEFSFIVRVLSRVPAPMPPTQLWETFQQFDGGHAALTAIELWEALRMEGIAITPKAAEKAMLAQLAREAARRQRLELQRNADIAATVAAEEKRAAERELARQKAAGEFDAPTCAEKLDSLIPRPQSAAQKAIAIASGATNGVIGVAGGSEETKAADREAAAGGVAQTGMAPDYNSLGYAGFREVWANVVASAGGKTLLEELEKRKLKKSRSRSKNAEALLNAVVTQDDKEDERFYAAKLAALEDRRVQRLSREMGPSALADVTSKEGKATRKAEAVADRRRQHLAQREAQRRRRQLKEEETLEAKMMREAELREQLVKDGERRRRKIEVEREEKRRAELGEHMIDWSGRGIAILPKELFLGAHNQERLGDVLTLDMSKNGLRMIPAFGALYWFNSLKKLDVSHNMLRELPGEVDSLTELVLMNASHNQLKSLPSQIGACHELKALDLSHNLLTELPEGVSEMHGLTYLNISSNKLVKLPKTMGNLTALRRLDASSNALGTELGEALSHSLGEMSELEVMDLSWNSISELPFTFGAKQSKLHTLTLSNNNITHLPDAIDGMVSLQSLICSRNGLLLLPDEMSRLTALTRLILPHNELPGLPHCFGGLINCTDMDLSHNKIATLNADAMSKLSSLVSLNLRSNRLTHLPTTIGALVSVKTLELGFNRLQGELETAIGTLSSLEALGIDHNRLEGLPPNLGFLKKLDELDASHNNLVVLPESLAQLNIRRLQLSNNKIQILPYALGELEVLEELDLSANSLEFLPAGLGRLMALRSLNLYNNRLHAVPLQMAKCIHRLEHLNADRNPFDLIVRWIAILPSGLQRHSQQSPPSPPRGRGGGGGGSGELPQIRDEVGSSSPSKSEETSVSSDQAAAWLAATEVVFKGFLHTFERVCKGRPIYMWPCKQDFADDVEGSLTRLGRWPKPHMDDPTAVECRCSVEDMYRFARENGIAPRFDAQLPEERDVRAQLSDEWKRAKVTVARRAKMGQEANVALDRQIFEAEVNLFREKIAMPYVPPAKVDSPSGKRRWKRKKNKTKKNHQSYGHQSHGHHGRRESGAKSGSGLPHANGSRRHSHGL